MEAEEKAGCLPENEMMVSTVTGCTASPSVAITVREWPSNVIWDGQTDPNELISRKR